MYLFGLMLCFVGLLFIALAGLEKILIFVAVSDRTTKLDFVIGLTPPYLWDITNFTFFAGIIFVTVGICLVSIKKKK